MSHRFETAAPERGPTNKVSAEALQTARVMVDAFRLATEASDSDGILNGILDGLAALVRYDAAAVYVVDAEGRRLRHTLARGCDLPVSQLKAPFDGQGVVGNLLATGKAVNITADTSPEASDGRPCARSRLVVPIVGSAGRVLGVLDVWSDEPDGYDEQTASLLAIYGLAVAGTIENVRLQAEMVDKRRLEGDLALARQVMDGLVPNSTPILPRFDIAGTHEASLEVGGDYYEFIPLAARG